MLVTENTWTPELERAIARLANADTPLWWYRTEVMRGTLSVLAVYIEKRRVGYVVWRMDQEPRGRCFAIIAASGNDPRFDLLESIYPALEEFARDRLHAKIIRFCTEREGMAERMRAHGFAERCYQFRKVFP